MISRAFPRLAVVALALLIGAGCNVVYKQNIRQGNVLDPDDLERLETGLTKRQVLVLLGSPAIQSPFHADRWDYINSFAFRGGDPEQRTLTVEFDNGRVSDYYGSYLENAQVTDSDLEKLEIIDPNTNAPVLPDVPDSDDEESG